MSSDEVWDQLPSQITAIVEKLICFTAIRERTNPLSFSDMYNDDMDEEDNDGCVASDEHLSTTSNTANKPKFDVSANKEQSQNTDCNFKTATDGEANKSITQNQIRNRLHYFYNALPYMAQKDNPIGLINDIEIMTKPFVDNEEWAAYKEAPLREMHLSGFAASFDKDLVRTVLYVLNARDDLTIFPKWEFIGVFNYIAEELTAGLQDFDGTFQKI